MKMWFEVKLCTVNIELQKKKGMKIGYIYGN
jgi:hypothetical protein